MNIAITGTIGSGKSGVASILAAALRFMVVDTDEICRQLLRPEQSGWQQLRQDWPAEFFQPDGEINRPLLRQAVFNRPELRRELETILHPLVRRDVQNAIKRAQASGRGLLVEVPLLFEVGWQDDFTTTVAVYAPTDICIQRTMDRDTIDHVQAEAIMSLQMGAKEKAEMADHIIDNSGLWSATVMQAGCLARTLLQQ